MALSEFLLGKRDVIMARWLREVLESYPDQSRHFLSQVKDPFANPVGATLSKELAALLDGLLAGSDPAALSSPLETVIKLRSVQGLTPSRALAFIFTLKQIAREVVNSSTEKEISTAHASGEALAFDAKVDELALSAFDLWSATREKISEIRINEMKRSLFVIERAIRPSDGPGPDPLAEPNANTASGSQAEDGDWRGEMKP
jgi:hypothetical protein